MPNIDQRVDGLHDQLVATHIRQAAATNRVLQLRDCRRSGPHVVQSRVLQDGGDEALTFGAGNIYTRMGAGTSRGGLT